MVPAHVNEQPLSLLRRSGFEAELGVEHIVPSVDQLQDWEAGRPPVKSQDSLF